MEALACGAARGGGGSKRWARGCRWVEPSEGPCSPPCRQAPPSAARTCARSSSTYGCASAQCVNTPPSKPASTTTSTLPLSIASARGRQGAGAAQGQGLRHAQNGAPLPVQAPSPRRVQPAPAYAPPHPGAPVGSGSVKTASSKAAGGCTTGTPHSVACDAWLQSAPPQPASQRHSLRGGTLPEGTQSLRAQGWWRGGGGQRRSCPAEAEGAAKPCGF